jgi:hypothetical protein
MLFDDVLVWELFTRSLGVIAVVHFLSIAHQIIPLIGSNGLEPAYRLFNAVKRDLNPVLRVLRFPSVFLLNCSDGFIRLVCYLGLAASIGIVWGGVRHAPILFLIVWACWLSIQTANPTVFSFPWDLLLSECLFFAAFLPRPAFVFYFNWLLFRVMFGMGLTRFRKLGETEREFTYIYHFYQWQPMPTPAAYYMRALPMWFHKLSFMFLFLAEVVAVFGIFGSPSMRLVAAVFIALLQLGIWMTGNYGTFNVLTLALCIPLLLPLADVRQVLSGPMVLLLFLTLPTFLIASFWTGTVWLYQRKALKETKARLLLQPVAAILRFIAPFRLMNSYGVFRYQEIYIRDRLIMRLQGTLDGTTWRDYETKFLSGPENRRPPFFAPYHPRLDHYLFYGLCEPHSLKFFMLMACNPYYYHPFCLTEKLVQKLLRNDPSALSMLGANPFPEKPPVSVRYALYKYNFTSIEEKRRTGNWWRTELLGTSEPIGLLDLKENEGLRETYDRFVSETLSRGTFKEREFIDPVTAKRIALHRHPVRRISRQVESAR